MMAKLDPRYTVSLKGFDRRGAAASIHNASATGFTVSGCWSDQADFAVVYLFDADDKFGHLFTSKYLPDCSLAYVTLDFDLSLTGCMSPVSAMYTNAKYQSVPWGKIGYLTSLNVVGAVALPAPTSTTGGNWASCTYTVSGTPVAYDRVQLIFQGNQVFDYIVPGGGATLAAIAANLLGQINATNWSTGLMAVPAGSGAFTVGLAGAQALVNVAGTAVTTVTGSGYQSFAGFEPGPVSINGTIYTILTVNSPTSLTLTSSAGTQTSVHAVCPFYSRDGNGIELLTMHKTSTTILNPVGTSKLTGGADPAPLHYHLDFSNLGLASCRQVWLTLAPWLTYDSGSAATASTVTFAFFNSFGTGYSHTITIGANTYTHVQLGTDGSGDIAIALAGLINAGSGDPNGSAVESANNVVLTARTASGASVSCSASDGNGPGTLTENNTSLFALAPFAPIEFSAVFANWTVVDAGGVTPLKLAGPGSVVIGNRDAWAEYSGSGWAQQAGDYFQGFARASSNPGDTVTVGYACQYTHSLYLGTLMSAGGGAFSVSVDGAAPVVASADVNESGGFAGRVPVATGLAAGVHLVVLTLSSGACVFDYLHAAVLSDPVAASVSYPALNAACDYDTDQTYKIPPARALWILSQMGFQGDLDFYAGVFFALKRVRSGGNFHRVTITLSGTIGGTDIVWMTVGGTFPNTGTTISGATTKGGNPSGGGGLGGTVLGAAAYPADTLITLAQRLVDAVNATFVGICAAPTTTAGQLTIQVLSAVNGFSLDVSVSAGASVGLAVAGDIGTTGLIGGQEGVWAVDASQASPLNRAFRDYLTDLAGLVAAAGQTMTVAFSQELLAPPDANTAAGAWTQRFPDGSTVLTATGFGSWGAGFVESVAAGVYQQTGHGYITGNTGHFANSTQSGEWALVVSDANHYTLGAQIANSGGYTPAAGDSVLIDLQTSQCTFNPATATAYLAKCYVQAAGILATAGLVPWLQFGEVGWWFYPRVQSLAVGYASWTAPISIGTAAAHTLATGNRVIGAGIQGNPAANGDETITVVDATHFTLDGSSGNGTYVAGTGTVSGGGMAYYDAWAAAAALTALGRALANFQHQDDDPAVNGWADAWWLAGAIKTHIDTIRAAVLAVASGAKFELLYPQDVNAAACYWTNDVPYPQGGRLNAAVNFPAAYRTQSGSGIDRLKVEALSWGATYRNLTNSRAAIGFATTLPCSWPLSAVAYLIPIYNGGCPWKAEYLAAIAAGIQQGNLWAVDHMVLFDWPAAMPANAGFAVVE